MNNEYKTTITSEDISFKELFLIFWNKKIIILSITIFTALLSIFYSLSLPNIYKSSALLAPTSQEDSLSSKLANYSAFAGLAGISLPSESGSKYQEAIERIRSLDFFSKHFLPHIELKNLMAVDEWDPKLDTITYDNSLFDSEENKWVRNVRYPKQKIPSTQEAYTFFIEDVLNIREDKKTSFISVSINHQSPNIAKKWVEIIIKNINESMRQEDKEKAKSSIEFLNASTESTNIQSLKEVVSKLLESQMQNLMLASSSDAYVFKVIDPPVAPELKSKPSRVVICILGTFFGGVFSLFISAILYLREIKYF